MIFKKHRKQVEAGQPALPVFFTIKELPLSGFIDCSVDNELIKLVKSGEATKEELEEQWMKVLSDYYQVRNDEGSVTYMELQKEIRLLQTRIAHLNGLIAYVVLINNALAIEMIQEYGYGHLTFGHETIEEDIKEVIRTEANTVAELTLLRIQLQEQNAGRMDKAKADDYYQMVMSISKVEQVRYSVRDFSTYEYAIACNRLEEHYLNLESNGGE